MGSLLMPLNLRYKQGGALRCAQAHLPLPASSFHAHAQVLVVVTGPIILAG